jgi:hypothetical protein
MLLVGDIRCLPDHKDKFVILNLSSLVEGYERVHLVPSISARYNDDKQFDIDYANYIFSNDFAFTEFMKIVYQLYMGLDVFLLVSRNENTHDIITESLCKLIQQRYGYNYQLLNNKDDIDYYDDSNFNIYGIQTFDIDKERYIHLLVKQNPRLLEIGDPYVV